MRRLRRLLNAIRTARYCERQRNNANAYGYKEEAEYWKASAAFEWRLVAVYLHLTR